MFREIHLTNSSNQEIFNHKPLQEKKTLKLYGPFLWIEINCLNAVEPLRDTLLSTVKFAAVTGTHLMNLEG